MCLLRSVPLGIYKRSRPMVFPLVPRCQGLWGSQYHKGLRHLSGSHKVMSQSITLATPASISLITLASGLPETLDKKAMFEGEVQLGDASGYVTISSVRNTQAVADEYKSHEDLEETFRKGLHDKVFYRIYYNDVTLLRTSLAAILQAIGPLVSDCWIDTDYGSVIQGVVFANQLRDPSWDWRRSVM
jgi:hypothetical protein